MALEHTNLFGVKLKNIHGKPWTEIEAALFFFAYHGTYLALGGDPNRTRLTFFWYCAYWYWGPPLSEIAKLVPDHLKQYAKEKVPPFHFIKHPWVERMAEAACEHDDLGLSGCGSSGKSDFMAVWGLLNWLAAPANTMVLATSTSLKESRKRIWGRIEFYFQRMREGLPRPGKLLSSSGQIRTECEGYKGTDNEGLALVAGEKSSEKEAVGKLIGIKQKRVILLADELAELPESILEATANLRKNDYFQMIAASNHKSITDSFGKFTEPKNGWGSVTVESEEWETKTGGKCLRFDGFKSPNIGLGRKVWPIYWDKDLKDDQERFGPKSTQFWRMCRSFPAPAGVADTIYSDADLISGGAFQKVTWSEGPQILLTSLDPSFTSGGDRSIQMIGILGYSVEGIHTLQIETHFPLQEDVTSREPFDLQVGKMFRDNSKSRHIPSTQAAYDVTGAGISFGTLMGTLWDQSLYPVKFGGGASDLLVPSGDTFKEAKELYSNRVTELWFVGREFLRGGQLRGITPEMAAEMTARKYETKKDGETKVLAETKTDMKERTGKSPDIADALMILIDLARARFGFVPLGQGGLRPPEEEPQAMVKQFDEVYSEDAVLTYD